MLKVSVDNFATEIIDKSYNKLVLLDISAEWCAPCKIITPLLDKAADEYADNAFIGKLEAKDENSRHL